MLLEVDERLSSVVDPRLTRRLIALELSDVVVPPPPGVSPEVAALHFRVVPLAGESLMIELWQLGQAQGQRTISSKGSGPLQARRIALTAAELTRQLRHRRNAEAARASREALAREAQRQRFVGVPIYGRIAFSARLYGATVGPDETWLAGLSAGVALRTSSGFDLELGGSYLAGHTSLGGQSDVRWIELALSPSYALLTGSDNRLSAGAIASVASLHLSEARLGTSPRFEFDTWSARAALQPSFETRLESRVWLRLAPEIGVALQRPVSVAQENAVQWGGLWLGLGAGIALDEAPGGQRAKSSGATADLR